MRTASKLSELFAIFFLFVHCAAAADSAPNLDHPFGSGKMYVGFNLGYASGLKIGNTGSGDAKDVRYLATFPSFGIGLCDSDNDNSWSDGNFDLVTEGEFITFLGPGAGHSMGLAVLGRYNFLSFGKFVPYGEIGVGVGFIESSLNTQADGLAFYPQGGLGVNYLISDHLSLGLSYRYHHISNKGTKAPNTGINTNLGLIGLQYYFD